MNKINTKSVLLCLISLILNLSVFLYYIPVINDTMFAWLLIFSQLLIIFYNHHILKNYKMYIIITVILMLSNIANVIITFIQTEKSFQEISNINPSTGQDMLGLAMAPAAVAIWRILVMGPSFIVLLECVISLVIRSRANNKKHHTS